MIYTLGQWGEEMKIALLSYHQPYGSCRLPCPGCGVIGFYSPREVGNRKYRACKFCGFWQEVDNGEPYRCIALYCSSCNIYDWTQPKEEKDFKSCEKCGSKYKKATWAVNNLGHPFWEIKKIIKSCKIHSLNQQKVEKLIELKL